MITNGFTYIAVLAFLAACLIGMQKLTKWKFFDFVPPVVLLYLIAMLCCTCSVWDVSATKTAYSAVRNPILYAMIFLMLLRCDIRQILKLGPRMLLGFFCASVSIAIAFILTYAAMAPLLGENAWRGLGALCGSWMGGSGNLVAVSEILHTTEAELAGASIVDSIDYSLWVMFLLWAVNLAPRFNRWAKADTSRLDEVSRRLDAEFAEARKKTIDFPSLMFLLGLSLMVSAICSNVGGFLSSAVPAALPFMSVFDSATYIIVLISVIGLLLAMTPIGKIAGSAELSNIMLYMVIALIASRASLLELAEAGMGWWIIAGFIILAIHGLLMLLAAKVFKLDMFTCGVASLANIGGTASAPILAASYSGSLVSVGVLMALMGYVVGTFGGWGVGIIMSFFAR